MISCWCCRKIMSIRMDANKELPQWVRHHLRECPACRETHKSLTGLARLLCSTSHEQRRSASLFLHGKIMAAVRSEGWPPPRPSRRLEWALALGTACLVAAGGVWLRHPPLPAQNALNPPSAPADLALNVKLPSATQVDQWTTTLDAPLEQETKLVLSDTATAINSLARGFLPEDFLTSSSGSARH